MQDEFYQLESEVDAKVGDAIRHAEETTAQTNKELDQINELLSEQAGYLESIRIEKEGFSPEQ